MEPIVINTATSTTPTTTHSPNNNMNNNNMISLDDNNNNNTDISSALSHLEGGTGDFGRKKKRKFTEKQKKKIKNYTLPSFVYGPNQVILPPIMLCPKIHKMLKPHQREGVRWLWTHFSRGVENCGCMLADHMGLGKTIQTIALICGLLGCGTKELSLREEEETGESEVENGKTNRDGSNSSSTTDGGRKKKRRRVKKKNNKQLAKRILVLSPKTVAEVWANEVKKFLGANALAAFQVKTLDREKSTKDRTRVLERWNQDGGLLIMGYEMYRNLVLATEKPYATKLKKFLCSPGPDMLVLDEGHRLRNDKNQIYKALSKVRTKRRLVLTGYPMQNHLMEYYAMVDYIRPGFLGTKYNFELNFARTIENGQAVDSIESDVIRARQQTFVLYNHVAPIVLRRDGLFLRKQLPPKHEWVLFTRLADIQYKLYKAFQRNRVKEFIGRGMTGAGKGILQAYHMCLAIINNVDILKMCIEDRRFLKDDINFDFLDDDLIDEYDRNSDEKRILTLVEAPVVTQYSKRKAKEESSASDEVTVENNNMMEGTILTATTIASGELLADTNSSNTDVIGTTTTTTNTSTISNDGSSDSTTVTSTTNVNNNSNSKSSSNNIGSNNNNNNHFVNLIDDDDDDDDGGDDSAEKAQNMNTINLLDDDDNDGGGTSTSTIIPLNVAPKRNLIPEDAIVTEYDAIFNEKSLGLIIDDAKLTKDGYPNRNYYGFVKICNVSFENVESSSHDYETRKKVQIGDCIVKLNNVPIPYGSDTATVATLIRSIPSRPIIVGMKRVRIKIENYEKDGVEAIDTINPTQIINDKKYQWAFTLLKDHIMGNMENSGKIQVVLRILAEAKKLNERVVLFSQSLRALNTISKALDAHNGAVGSKNNEGMNGSSSNSGSSGSSSVDSEYSNLPKNAILEKFPYVRIDGKTPFHTRHENIKQINDPTSNVCLILVSTRAGGEGISLVGATRMILFDVCWNPSYDHQAMCRCYRYGQTKPVHVYRLVASGTMEEHVYRRQVIKETIAMHVVDDRSAQRQQGAGSVQNMFFDVNKLKSRQQQDMSDNTKREDVGNDVILKNVVNNGNGWITDWYQQDTLFAEEEDAGISEEHGEILLKSYQNSNKTGMMMQQQQENFVNGTINSQSKWMTAPKSQLIKEDLLKRQKFEAEYQEKLKEARKRNAGFWSKRALKSRSILESLVGKAREEKLMSMRDPWLTDDEQKEKVKLQLQRQISNGSGSSSNGSSSSSGNSNNNSSSNDASSNNDVVDLT